MILCGFESRPGHIIKDRLIKIICDYLTSAYMPKRGGHKAFSDSDIRFFAKGAGALSNAFTKERTHLPKNYLNLKEYRTGYLLYFTITNYLKAMFCLEEIGANTLFKERVKILDIGCGPGTATLAALDHFKNAEAVLIDQNRHILKDASEIIRRYVGNNFRFKTVCDTISARRLTGAIGHEQYNIIFLSNFLSEFRNPEESLLIVQQLIARHLKHNGVVITIEPALQSTSRRLMLLRDELLRKSGGEISVLSPCLHDSTCPMLHANQRDWCHMYLDWERPLVIEKIDRLIGNRKDYLKFSYLIITNDEAKPANSDVWRVVSAPLISRGKTELLVCNRTGMTRLSLLDRDLTNGNRIMKNLQRGRVIKYAGPSRLDKKSIISLISS